MATRRLTTVRIPNAVLEWCRCTIVDANRKGGTRPINLTDMIVAGMEMLRQTLSPILTWDADSIARTLIALVNDAQAYHP